MVFDALSNVVSKTVNEVTKHASSLGGPRIALDSLKIRSIIDAARNLSDPHNELFRTITKGVETVARQMPEAPAIVRTPVKIGNDIASGIADEVPILRTPAKQLAGSLTTLLELLKGQEGAKSLVLAVSQLPPITKPQILAEEGVALV